jgi:hypothetical protein
VHTDADMGSLRQPLEKLKMSTGGKQGLARGTWLANKTWDEIERVVDQLPRPAGTVRIYQDGLPVCGNEQRVIAELAEAGSRNHRLIQRLVGQGAIPMGTESAELLLEEYELAVASLAPRGLRSALRSAGREKALGESLLDRRDRFIGARINSTLADGETGILFLGLLHAVERHLDRDITVVHPTCSPQEAA